MEIEKKENIISSVKNSLIKNSLNDEIMLRLKFVMY